MTHDLIRQLPVLPRNVHSRENSSYHRGGLNQDHGNFLYVDNGEAVLFDTAGPGCVNSIFATNLLGDTTIIFYFDGQPEPTYRVPIQEFFRGSHPHFPPPMVSYRKLGYYLGDDSLAGNCLLPIPFARSLKITATGELDFFYHILWEKYPYGANVSAFPNAGQAATAKSLWDVPVDTKELFSEFKTLRLGPGEKAEAFHLEGSASVGGLLIELPCRQRLLSDLFLSIRWDGQPHDGVHAPLGMLFAVPIEVVELDTPPVSVRRLADRLQLVCRWPMPFWEDAEISLINRGEETVEEISCAVSVVPGGYDREECGYFTAHYRQGRTEHGEDWTLLSRKGWGKYVGTVQTMQGEHYCEGDEHFSLDGACDPQINGTGTEDYYLFCFWPNPSFCTPVNGCTTDVFLKADGLEDKRLSKLPVAYYRFHLDGPIAFYSSIDARIQHGAVSTNDSNYSSLALCYLRQAPAMVLSDVVEPVSEASRTMHRYEAEREEFVHTVSAAIGATTGFQQGLNGCEHDGGDISFTVIIYKDNDGVMLRRRIDQSHIGQRADVYIDGQYAGEWYDTDRNDVYRWRDSDFLLPPDLCRGKGTLHILLAVAAGSRFTAYRYEAYSFVRPE